MRERPLSPPALSPNRRISPASPSPLAVESLALRSSSQADTTTNDVTNRNVTERRSPEGSSCRSEMTSVTDMSLQDSQQSGSMQSPSVKPFTFTGTHVVAPNVNEEEGFDFSPELLTESPAKLSPTTNSLTLALMKDPLLVQNLIQDYPGLRELFQATRAAEPSALPASMPLDCDVSSTEGLSERTSGELGIDEAADVGEPVFPVLYREMMAGWLSDDLS